MRLTKVISTSIVKGLQVIKHAMFKDVTNQNELISDFGVDANPYPNIKGAHQSATTSGRGGIIGFFNKFVAALHGERRMYSTLPDGSEIVTEIFQMKDGSILMRAGIIGGVEKYSLLIDPGGGITETTTLKTLTGNMVINGNLTVNGVLTATQILTTAGIDSDLHKHPYTDDGNPLVTLPPVP